MYENQHALPIGYTYDSYLPKSEYDQLSVLDKQYAMLHSAILEDDLDVTKFTDISSLSKATSSIPIQNMELKNVIINNNTLKVTKKNGSITLTFNGVKNAETYVSINNLRGSNAAKSVTFLVSYNGASKSSLVAGDNSIYKRPQNDYLTI